MIKSLFCFFEFLRTHEKFSPSKFSGLIFLTQTKVSGFWKQSRLSNWCCCFLSHLIQAEKAEKLSRIPFDSGLVSCQQ